MNNSTVTMLIAEYIIANLLAVGINLNFLKHTMIRNTKNAIGMLVEYCLANGVLTAEEEKYFKVLSDLHSSTDGAGVGIASDDGIFTPLTCIGGMMKLEDGRFVQNINIRFPTSITGDEIKAKLTEKLEKTTGKKILLTNRVDPDCLGGVILQFSDMQINDSIAQKLETLKNQLKNINR